MSRNIKIIPVDLLAIVTSREGRVSRNVCRLLQVGHIRVTSREGRVSRNKLPEAGEEAKRGHVPRGTCE